MRVLEPERIARARRGADLTQYQLAALARCTQATISALETGTMRGCSKDLAESIARWTKYDIKDLFEEHTNTRVHRVTNAAGSSRRKTEAAA